MKKCLVLGGGLAGLTAAVYLSRSNYPVELIEASPKLGGRTYSFVDRDTAAELDNGQHIMMGCYKETLALLDIIEAMDMVDIQTGLEVNFLKEGFNNYTLKAANLPYPLNLVSGFLKYKALSFSESINVLKLFLKLIFYSDSDLEKLTIREWLAKENQTKNSIECFWGILAVGALNTNINKASAGAFSSILKEIFLRGSKAAAIILPGSGLSKVFVEPARQYIEKHSSIIYLSETVKAFEIKNNRIVSVETAKRIITDFDIVVSALPSYALKKIIDLNIPDLDYSTIVSINIWLEEKITDKKFFGLIGSPVHWIFNHDSHLTLVISDADYLSDTAPSEIFDMAAAELKKYINLEKGSIKNYKVVKEKRATFVPSPFVSEKRGKTRTLIQNLLLAGDWIQTGLPSTIESAVKSGKTAAFKILNGIYNIS